MRFSSAAYELVEIRIKHAQRERELRDLKEKLIQAEMDLNASDKSPQEVVAEERRALISLNSELLELRC